MTTINIQSDVKKYTNEELDYILEEAFNSAKNAANKLASEFIEKYGAIEVGSCGFAWVNVYDLRGNTKVAKYLYSKGMGDSWTKGVKQFWNPCQCPVQNVDIKEAGAEAFASVLCKYNFNAYAGSRLD